VEWLSLLPARPAHQPTVGNMVAGSWGLTYYGQRFLDFVLDNTDIDDLDWLPSKKQCTETILFAIYPRACQYDGR
jgi:hypothetical protein